MPRAMPQPPFHKLLECFQDLCSWIRKNSDTRRPEFLRIQLRPVAPSIANTLLALCCFVTIACASALSPASAAITSSGNVTPDPTTTTSSDNLYVGNTADGNLTVNDGSMVENRHGFLGFDANSSGTAVVNGSGSTWNSFGNLNVGNSGTGTLAITGSGSVSNLTGSIGKRSGSTGGVVVDGNGSIWTNSRSLFVGDDGNGTLAITDGGTVVSSSFSFSERTGYIGLQLGSTGSVTVDGVGSTWINSGGYLDGFIAIGRSGDGTLAISGGGTVSNSYADIGLESGSTGRVTVDGVGSTWTNRNDLWVGYDGNGTLAITGGGSVTNNAGYIGSESGSTSSATVDGNGSTWTNSGNLSVGVSGTGTLTITAGGVVDVASDVFLNSDQNGSFIKFDGGTLNSPRVFAAQADLRGTGTINTGGWLFDQNLTIASPGDLPTQIVLADQPGQNITVNLNWTGQSIFGVDQGAVTIANGQQVTGERGYIGYWSGSTGSVTVEGTGSAWTTTDRLFVGFGGAGMLAITGGGVVDVTSDVIVNSNQNGSFIEFGGGTLNARSVLTAHADLHGTGTINTEGWLFDQNITIASPSDLPLQVVLASQPSQNITVNLNWTGQGIFGADQGTVTITNGEQVTGDQGYIGYASGSTGSVTVDGVGSTWTSNTNLYVGSSGTGALAISGGGAVSNSSGYVGSDSSSMGSVTVDGVDSTWTSSSKLYVGSSGTGTLAISGGGAVFNSSGYIGTDSNSTGVVTVDGYGSTWTNGTLHVGHKGDGALAISGGGSVSNSTGRIGRYAGSTGSVTVNGVGSNWTNRDHLYVGYEGSGTLAITDGGRVSNSWGFVGWPGSTGSVTVDGLGSTWTNNTHLHVGYPLSGVGTLLIANGGHVAVGEDLRFNYVSTLGFTLASTSDPFLDVNRTAALNGTLSVDVAPSLTLAAGDTFTIIEIGGSRLGQFIGLNEGDSVGTFGNTYLEITYAGGDGNDVELVVLLFGDMNGDGLRDESDAGPLVQALVNRAGFDAAYPTVNADFVGDIDHNGLFDLGDLAAFKSLVAPEPGDMNGDGLVNLADVQLLVMALTNSSAFENEFVWVNADLAGDVDGSGMFDLGDLGAFSSLLGGPASAAAVPEPGSAVLLAWVGLALAVGGRRGRRR